MSIPEMAPLNPEPFGGSYVHERPYRQLYPPEPVTKRHIVSTKDDTFIDEHGTETRVPVEERPPKRITRITTFGVEVIDLDHHGREDQTR